MPKYKIELDDFCEDIFHEMERLSIGVKAHEFIVEAKNHSNAVAKTAGLLMRFFKRQLLIFNDENIKYRKCGKCDDTFLIENIYYCQNLMAQYCDKCRSIMCEECKIKQQPDCDYAEFVD